MAASLADVGAKRLAYAIVRRAYEDYYNSFFSNKLPRRPKIAHVVNGKTIRELATDHEYHEWLVDWLTQARKRRKEVERFVWSSWYDELVDMETDGKEKRVNFILQELKFRRRNGIGMFANDYDDGMEE